MSDQFSFGFGGPPPPAGPLDSVFFSLIPDFAAKLQIAELTSLLAREYPLSGPVIPPERLHVTLQYLFLPRDSAAAFAERAALMAREIDLPAFDLTFDRVLSFQAGQGGYPLVLRGDAELLLLLRQQLGAAMRRLGAGEFVKTAFTPHITMLYDKVTVPEQAVAPITWTVREFVLVHSLRGETRHVILGRWPLRS